MIKKEEVKLLKQLVQSNQIDYLDIATVLSGIGMISRKNVASHVTRQAHYENAQHAVFPLQDMLLHSPMVSCTQYNKF